MSSKQCEGFPIISEQVNVAELGVIMRELRRLLSQNIPGDVVEFGCYEGTTSLFLQREVVKNLGRKLHVYDSFDGLPEKTAEDLSPAGEQFKAGELKASKANLIAHFKKASLPLPVIHKGWFQDFKDEDMPSEIAFAFLDGDFYGSILDSLRLIWPRLSKGAVVIVDDYAAEALPGAARAVRQWQKTHNFMVSTEQSLAIIRL